MLVYKDVISGKLNIYHIFQIGFIKKHIWINQVMNCLAIRIQLRSKMTCTMK